MGEHTMQKRTVTARVKLFKTPENPDGEWKKASREFDNYLETSDILQFVGVSKDHKPRNADTLHTVCKIYNQHQHIANQAIVVKAIKGALGIGNGSPAKTTKVTEVDISEPVDKPIPNAMDSVGESKPTTVKK